FVGELGWEIHCKTSDMTAFYDSIIQAGVTPFGMYALNSLRLEKGYRTWKGDLSSDYSMLEGGLNRFIKWDKPDFPGKAALENERQQGSKKQFVTLVVDSDEYDPPYMSPVWLGNQLVGETTSGGMGYRSGKVIALGVVDTAASTPGTDLNIEIFGKKHKAIVQPDQPIWDPENERLRA
ncbi:MAG: glycine cleavage T C-terminal barrel domain-containing protein, partial [Pseudomonadota bacterium]